MDEQIFELSLLSSHAADDGNPASFVVLARYGTDIAIESLTCEDLQTLQQFRTALRGMILGEEKRPTADALRTFGSQLFDFTIRGSVLRLYNRLPAREHVRLHLVSNCPALLALPWEYLREPDDIFPNPSRSVVRIVPTVGQTFDPEKQPSPGGKIRLLFVWSEPANQSSVEWDAVEKEIKDTFRRLPNPENFEITVVQAANRLSLLDAVRTGNHDILHFCGHGEVRDGQGYLLLQSVAKNNAGQSDSISAEELRIMLQGLRHKISLVVLGACDTGSGDFAREYAVIAHTLVEGGIPAVVANQFPVTNPTMLFFAHALYDELLSSGDIDLAVRSGRNQIGLSAPNLARLECGIPTLYRHSKAYKLFNV